MDHSRASGEPNKNKKDIAIIGAGISGLLACKHAVETGFDPAVFEARNCVGGVWARTVASTKLQTPKDYFRFSDFAWPDSVSPDFPAHDQVLEYVRSYAVRFGVIPRIRFNSKVVAIDYVSLSDDDVSGWDGCGGEAFSSSGKWNVVVQDALDPMNTPTKVYQVDFVILCIGKFSDLPNMPQFPISKGIEAFKGEVLHSMDYAAMDRIQAANFTANKRVAVVGCQKSALDIAAEIAENNGSKYPCTLVFRRAHWSGSENLVKFTFRNLNRFSELMVHKPDEGFIIWFIAVLLSPLRWIFSKIVECYLRWIYPLKTHDMVPDHPFLRQIYSCMFTVLPENFYDGVRDGSLVLKRSRVSGLYRNGLILDRGGTCLETDVIIFATGFKSDQKIADIFSSIGFKKCITGSSAPFYRVAIIAGRPPAIHQYHKLLMHAQNISCLELYKLLKKLKHRRECIHPRIPQLAILGYSESPATLFTFELRSKWIAHFLAGKFRLPPAAEMEENARKWEKNARSYSRENYKRACVGVLLQIHCNDLLCRDMGCNPRRKSGVLSEAFSPYRPADYAGL